VEDLAGAESAPACVGFAVRMDMVATRLEQDPRIFNFPEREFLRSGHLACPGCGAALGMRLALKALGPETIVVIPACCWSIVNGAYPYSALAVPVMQVAFETAAVSAAGVRAALDMQGRTNVQVLAWAGDGGTFDIGLQSLSGTVERNDDIIYVCYDNEAYMNTGIQRSSATPPGAWTMTTPAGALKREPKKNIVEILVEHGIPYAATASIAFPDDFVRKLMRARSIRGTRFIHLFASCPTGYKCEERHAIKIARLAVESGLFPLYEVESGYRYTLNHEPSFVDVTEYLGLQGRFRYISQEQVESIRRNLAWQWRRLRGKAALGKSLDTEKRESSPLAQARHAE
jgi:pyruvate/2-oxoacid:ferredoxin oxidoreductase beta subunit